MVATTPAMLSAPAAAAPPPGQDFEITRGDLEFILKQIDISEAHGWRVTQPGAADNAANNPLCPASATFSYADQVWADLHGDPCVSAPTLPFGLRTVDGRWNNLHPDRDMWGAANQAFPRLLEQEFVDADPVPPGFPMGTPGTATSYAQLDDGFVFDAQPRLISNLIVDQTTANPAAVEVRDRVEGAHTLDGEVLRVGGSDRFATAAEVSMRNFAPGVPVVFIASGANFPDALAASSAAARNLSPILLVRPDGIPQATIAELQRLAPQRIVVLGGSTVINDPVVTALQGYTDGDVDRVAGSNRYATAAAISAEFFQDTAPTPVVYLATGADFADALAVGALAASASAGVNGSPLLLTLPTSLPAVTVAELERLRPSRIVIAGGAGTISAGVAEQLAGYTDEVVRLSGADRYETAVEISRYAHPTAVPHIYLSTGATFPDALAGGVVAGITNAPVLLVPPNPPLPQSVVAEILRLDPHQVHLLGGEDAISGPLADAVADLLGGRDIFIPDVATDEGLSASMSTFLLFFGQFFDHGLDLVSKGQNGTIVVPLHEDDPMYDPAADTNFLTLSRATVSGVDDAGQRDHENRTTPFVDQSQTYASHPSHHVFLREYAAVGGVPVPTGKLLDGWHGDERAGLPTWGDVKDQARDLLGIELVDADVLEVPLLVTDPYGRFVPGPNGLPQIATGSSGMLEGDLAAPVRVPDDALRAGHSFLDDIAHGASPDTPAGYDNAALEAHFVTGDGRGNENMGLTAVHHVFHAEHNRVLQQLETILHEPGNEDLLEGFRNGGHDGRSAGFWDYSERVFQAARFVTEMEYQHLVFEEFARRIAPSIDATILNENSYMPDVNPAIVAEFAHVVYRFGHSALTQTVDRVFEEETSGVPSGTYEMPLLEAFLNPNGYLRGPGGEALHPDAAAGALIQGTTHQTANGIDEFVTDTLRNELLGLPLDLASINLMRGRDTGVPPLQTARDTFFQATGDPELAPYASWRSFELQMKNPESLGNFIAAYGTHEDLDRSTMTVSELRDVGFSLAQDATFKDAPAAETGLDDVDFWMGGLAEKPEPFGNMLGSTFNFVFEKQLEDLQNGDRFYYLTRNHGQSFFFTLEANSFSELIQRNTDIGPIPFDIFSMPSEVFDLRDDPDDLLAAGLERRPDGTWHFTGEDHVVIHGTDGGDRITAGLGDDTIWGGAGPDVLQGGAGVDVLAGGDGDDILTDIHGDEDRMLGQAGNDAINGGPGFGDLLMGGSGTDWILGGADRAQVFAGLDDDFIQGSPGPDLLWGNEGDDWIEGSFGHDLLQGDNGNGFFNDPWGGHDIMIGGPGNSDYDAEGGDDIMVGGEGTERFHGMLGFDWVTYKDLRVPIQADLAFTPQMPDDLNNVRDRYWLVEALSGSPQNDILRGQHRQDDAYDPTRGLLGYGHRLTQEHLDRILGLRELLGGGEKPVYADPFLHGEPMLESDQTNNIILGGPGSDIIEPREGRNFVDGDAYLDVYIEHRPSGPDGEAVERGDRMSVFNSRVFAGTINPGDLHMVREIVHPTAMDEAELDTVVLPGRLEHYTIDELDDGNVLVTFEEAPTAWSHVLRNIERLSFNDRMLCLLEDDDDANLCGMPSGAVTIGYEAPEGGADDWTEGGTVVTTVEDLADPQGVQQSELVYELQVLGEVERLDIEDIWVTTQVNTTGEFQLTNVEVDLEVRVVVSFEDDAGTQEFLASDGYGPVINVNDAPVPPVIAPALPGVGSQMFVAQMLTDADGTEVALEEDAFDHRWQSSADGESWNDIPGATANRFTVTETQLGQQIRLVIEYTDDRGTDEVAVSEATAHVLPGATGSASLLGAGGLMTAR
nr:peroxidase family protein [Ornithinimicrobium cryptoxanthini]